MFTFSFGAYIIMNEVYYCMAQVLKEETRKKIIEAAKDEFLHYGFDNANMRRIALKSNMTVGNLYRYFKSKEDLNYQIVNEVVTSIDSMVKDLTGDRIAFFNEDFSFPESIEILRSVVNELSDNIVDIYMSHKDEFNILMMGSELNNSLMKWFISLINFLITSTHGDKNPNQIALLARSYCVSMISGLKELFWVNDVEIDNLKDLVKIYLQSFVYMLQVDVGKYIGD